MNPNLPVRRSDDIKSQIFLSFSHEDKDRAEAIARTLSQNGIAVWIDYRNIVPGTPDWEDSIREGLAKSLAVVVLASPQSRRSQYVRSELALARSENLPIYPLWIDGNQWPDCIALDLVFTQYIDARDQREPEGIKQLCSAITALSCNIEPDHFIMEDALAITCTEQMTTYDYAKLPAGFINILLDHIPNQQDLQSGKTVMIRGAVVRVDRYKVIGQLLDDIYTQYLYKKYKPMTYGSKWLLLGMDGREFDRALAPWAWLKDRREAFPQWAQNRSLLTCNVRPGSVWTIGMSKPSQFIGIASRDHRFLDTIRKHPKARYVAFERLLEPVKDELSCDENLIEEVVNKGAIYWKKMKGRETYIQIAKEVKLEEFLSFWNR